MSWFHHMVKDVFGEEEATDNVHIPCPLAGWRHPNGVSNHRSFTIAPIRVCDAVSYCWSCGWAGNLRQLYKEAKTYDPALAGRLVVYTNHIPSYSDLSAFFTKELESVSMAKKPSPVKPDFPPIEEGQWNRFPFEAQTLFGLEWDETTRSVVFPIFAESKTGEMEYRGYQRRPMNPGDGPKYIIEGGLRKGYQLYGEWVNPQKTVVLVEGVADAISVSHRTGLHCCAVLGSSLTKTQAKRVSAMYEKVWIFPDNDSAGWKGAAKSIALLLDNGMTDLSIVDYQGLGFKDPDECPTDVLTQLVSKPKPIVAK